MEVIELSSDSNDCEPLILPTCKVDSVPEKKYISSRSAHNISDDDFDFPEVPFAFEVARKEKSDSERTLLKTVSKSNDNIEEELLSKYVTGQTSSKVTASAKTKKGSKNQEKEELRIQKASNAREAATKKAEKAAAAMHAKSLRPEHCMKYMKVIIDPDLQNFSFFDVLINELQGFQLNYQLKSQIIPNSVIWTRTKEDQIHKENQILLVWDYAEVVKKVSDGTLVASIVSSQELLPGKVVTLIIYGIANYFRYYKNLKRKQTQIQCEDNTRSKKKRRSSKVFQELPIISKKELELCLTEIQIRVNYNSRLIETPQSLGSLIKEYTKAIAEAPFKIQKRQAIEDQLSWCPTADNRDTVPVDKFGNGLKRLWQQQLCTFNLSKLETAEAIISKYPSPLHLIEAYSLCTPSEGKRLLQDIPIRRTAGPLTAVRRIGPELSKKLYIMFTSEDGDALLDDD